MAAVDLYEVLELTTEATEQDIKKAFRKLSILYHPDKNPSDKQAHQRYLDVNRAYEILLDPEQRQIYDLYGEQGLQDMKSGWRNKQKGPNA
jgi:DnaJ-class molecular chaperone